MKLKKIALSASIWLFVILCTCLTWTLASKDNCSTCRRIVDNFKQGVDNTKKSNFGGGNTRWEEKSLGAWAHSETRLVEIMESLCTSDAKECHMLLEKHEEDLEDYWFNVHGKSDNDDMLEWFCINKLKVCCPDNTYGKSCKECPGGVKRPCSGNGKCGGEGTRKGNGKCSCNDGYRGDLCNECTDKYFEEIRNDTHTVCTACHESCASTCWEAGPKGCDDCKSPGWTMSEADGCVDVDECETPPCGEDQYCSNTPGHYNCATCHRSCVGCKAYGSEHCEACKDGYRLQADKCEDINECTEDTTLCTGDKLSCTNTDGSYECTCEDGLIYEGDSKTCIPKPKDPPKPPKSKSKERKKKNGDSEKPSLLFLLAMLLIFCVCCSMVQWNMVVVFCLSVVLATFIYWFGAQHDKL